MSDFLLELRCEEIPARMQAGARADLQRLFAQALADAGIHGIEIAVWSTPRRLALVAYDLPEATEAVREEEKGPPVGAPDQAVDGFCRKHGLSREQLEARDVKGRETWFAVIEKPGRAVKDLLAEAIPAIVRAFPWPKSMRWGAASISTESLRWVRPLSGIVAILGEELVEFEIAGVPSSFATVGHRFHHPGAITIGGAHDYADKLRACHVIVDHAEREALIRVGATAAASEAGLTLVEDEGLVVENAGLTEWPVPLLGRFDEAFLDVPPEVIQLTARVNQKYFVCTQSSPERGGGPAAKQTVEGAPSVTSPDGEAPPPRAGEDLGLANAFVCTANIEANDGGAAIVDGNRKVLAARLSDARFFWEQDRKTPLAEQAKKLERITFHEKLGTVADKVERVAKLAEWLASEGIVPNCDPKLARQGAELCKADLVTEMVGEFPELQGLMGGYYARAEGLPDAVADAIRDHYKPVGQGDEVPTAPVTVAVSLADKLDTLACFFAVDEKPTGSKDPFALRRAAIAALRLVQKNGLRTSFFTEIEILRQQFVLQRMKRFIAIDARYETYLNLFWKTFPLPEASIGEVISSGVQDHPNDREFLINIFAPNVQSLFYLRTEGSFDLERSITSFLYERLDNFVNVGGNKGVLAAAVTNTDSAGYASIMSRALALKKLLNGEVGKNLLSAYKRGANILGKENWSSGGDAKELSYTPEPAEKALIDALAAAEPRADAAVEAEDFEAAMAALASLRAPIDRFFDEVTVNAPEENKRAARLDLLARFRAAVHKVADFSRIEG